MSKTHEVKLTLDGITFRGCIPLLTRKDLPLLADIIDEHGDLIDGRELERFEGKAARRVGALGLHGLRHSSFVERSPSSVSKSSPISSTSTAEPSAVGNTAMSKSPSPSWLSSPSSPTNTREANLT